MTAEWHDDNKQQKSHENRSFSKGHTGIIFLSCFAIEFEKEKKDKKKLKKERLPRCQLSNTFMAIRKRLEPPHL